MQQSPSWEANGFSASQKFSRILRNPNIHYHTHNRRSPASILSQINPVHAFPYHFLKIHIKIFLPSTLRSCTWSLFFGLSDQKPVCAYPHTCYMPQPSHSSLFYHPNSIGWAVRIIKLFNLLFFPFPCYFVPLRPKYSPQHPILKHPQPSFLPQCEQPSFTPIQKNKENYIY